MEHQKPMLTEKEATKEFEKIVPKDFFIIHRQQKGKAIHVKKLKRIFAEWDGRKVPNTGIVDFILEPTERLINIGWGLGCIGVEIKSSFSIEKNPGRAIVQILDYQSCTYTISGNSIELPMIFLFPHRHTALYLASIMQQEGLGFVRSPSRHREIFQLVQANTSNESIFTFSDGKVEIKKPRYGKKFGHR